MTAAPPRKIFIPATIRGLYGDEQLKLDRKGNPYHYEMPVAHVATGADLSSETAERIAADQALLSAIINETMARIAGDNALQAGINAGAAGLAQEIQARITGDQHEATTRNVADNQLGARIINETNARIAADALLVPIAQLCTLWANCDFSFLPTTDPGLGRVWQLDGHLVIGTARGTGEVETDMSLEDDSGDWTLEVPSSSDIWTWG